MIMIEEGLRFVFYCAGFSLVLFTCTGCYLMWRDGKR